MLDFSFTPLTVVLVVAAIVDDKIEEGFGDGTDGCDLNTGAAELCDLGVNDGICLGGAVTTGCAAVDWADESLGIAGATWLVAAFG